MPPPSWLALGSGHAAGAEDTATSSVAGSWYDAPWSCSMAVIVHPKVCPYWHKQRLLEPSRAAPRSPPSARLHLAAERTCPKLSQLRAVGEGRAGCCRSLAKGLLACAKRYTASLNVPRLDDDALAVYAMIHDKSACASGTRSDRLRTSGFCGAGFPCFRNALTSQSNQRA